MKTIEAKIEQMDKQLKQWGAKLDEFVAKAEGASAGVKSDYTKHIEELKDKHRIAQTKLDELKVAGTNEWQTFKTGVESAWNELEVAIKSLTN